MSKRKGEVSTSLAAIGHVKHRTRGAAWVAKSKGCQKYNVKHIPVILKHSDEGSKKTRMIEILRFAQNDNLMKSIIFGCDTELSKTRIYN